MLSCSVCDLQRSAHFRLFFFSFFLRLILQAQQAKQAIQEMKELNQLQKAATDSQNAPPTLPTTTTPSSVTVAATNTLTVSTFSPSSAAAQPNPFAHIEPSSPSQQLPNDLHGTQPSPPVSSARDRQVCLPLNFRRLQ